MAKTKTTRVKAKAASWPVPQNHEQVADAIARIGELQRERGGIEAAMNAEMAAVKERFEAAVAPVNEQIKGLSGAVQTYCEARRGELTADDRRKFYRFTSGKVHWRLTPPKVRLKQAAAVLDWLKANGPVRFLREKVEVNKEAMLGEPALAATVPGVAITQDEDFVITPFETKLEEIA